MHETAARMHVYRREINLRIRNPPQHYGADAVHSHGTKDVQKAGGIKTMKRILGALTLAAATLIPAAAAHAQVGIAVQIGPPAPAYYAAVPPCPGPGYYWAPGYYSGRVWVPGRWAYRASYGPRYYHYDEHYYRHDHDWDDHDHGHHYGWYKHHDDDGWRR
jgi:hypothetical protein